MSTARTGMASLGVALLLASVPALVVETGRRLQSMPARGVTTFPLSQVRVLDGPFKHAQELNIDYVHALEPDRLLAPYRSEAGLKPKAPKYPNWESTGLEGHTAGHYLTALAQIWAATGDPDMKQRLDYMVAELATCQRSNHNGYVGGIPGSRQLWDEVAAGTLRVEPFAINGKWVPWYNLHKLFAGLRDAHLVGANAQARSVLIELADWAARLVSKLSDAQMQAMLGAEHGGMNEVLADVYALTRDDRYLALARRFSHRALLEHLERREDTLTGLHANTQIPKAIGYARIAELGGDAAGLDAARFFWHTVVRHRTVAFGGNSVREHFNPPDDFSSMIESREGPETCNTYNMLRLTERLFRTEPSAEYADFYERALFNHILSTEHPVHGGFVYFTPIRPRHYRVYSQPSQCFWCCVGTGMENHGKYGQFIYAHTDDELYVNLFIGSALRWPERDLELQQETSFPDEPRTRLVLSLQQPQRFTLRVRHPVWAAESHFEVRVNGQPRRERSAPGSYASIAREWKHGDRVEIDLPMRTAIEPLPDGSDYVAILHGPIVLAARTGTEQLDGQIAGDARMAHVSPGPYLPLDSAPMLVGDLSTLADHIRPVAGSSMTFTASAIIRPAEARSLELVPFFRVHDSRYMIYWRAVAPDKYSAVVDRLRIEEEERLALEARTIDRVTPGAQQPEVEHHLRSDGSTTGSTNGRSWREASGWFSYDLTLRTADAQRSAPGTQSSAPDAAASGTQRTVSGGPLELRVTYSAGQRDRQFDIRVNDRVIATVTLNGGQPDRFLDATYPIPVDLVSPANGVLTVTFAAKPGSRAGAVYDVRLLAGR
jgi:uncharacterized protein